MSATRIGLFDAVVREALTAGVTVRFRAAGASMYPTIRDGETVSIAPVELADIVYGDVLLYRASGRLLAHRVVGLTASRERLVVHVRGDAKRACDAPVDGSDVVGRVIAVDRGGRVIPLHGRIPRLQHGVRAALSRARQRLRRAPANGCETC